MKKIIDQAIVLRRINYGESDRVLTLLTKEHGKISVFAKGVRKQKSRLSGGIELLCVSEIGYIEGKSDLKTLISAQMASYFEDIVKDISKTRQAFEALKRIEKLSDENAGQEYYSILETYLSCLADESYDLELVEAWLKLQILNEAGVLGDIKVEGNKEGDEYQFDYDKQWFEASRRGGFSKDDIKLLRLLRANKKPIKLKKKTGSENRIASFTETLASMNL